MTTAQIIFWLALLGVVLVIAAIFVLAYSKKGSWAERIAGCYLIIVGLSAAIAFVFFCLIMPIVHFYILLGE